MGRVRIVLMLAVLSAVGAGCSGARSSAAPTLADPTTVTITATTTTSPDREIASHFGDTFRLNGTVLRFPNGTGTLCFSPLPTSRPTCDGRSITLPTTDLNAFTAAHPNGRPAATSNQADFATFLEATARQVSPTGTVQVADNGDGYRVWSFFPLSSQARQQLTNTLAGQLTLESWARPT